MPIYPISKNLSNYLSNILSKFGYPFILRKKYPNILIQIFSPLISIYLKKYLNLDRIFLSRKNFLDRVFPVLYPLYDYPDNSITKSGAYPPPFMYMLMSDRAKIIYLKNRIEQILIIDLVQNQLRSYYIIYSS